MRISVALLIASLSFAAGAKPALAQDDAAKERALSLYDEATKKYNIGEWREAVRLYKEAYSAFPAPEFLFNIGQAYRQDNDCKNGLFFYKRYLANKPDAENRTQVEGFITDLEAMCKKQDQVRQKQPSNPVPPDGRTGTGATGTGTGTQNVQGAGGSTAATTAGSGGATTATGITTTAEPVAPSLAVINAEVGLGVVRMGGLETTSQLSLKIGAGYPLALGPVTIEAGGALTFTTLQWENNAGASGNSGLWGFLANARAIYPLAAVPGLSITGELGLGLLAFTGISDDAAPVFLEPGLVADGAPTMAHFRVSGGVEYAFMRNLGISLSPVFSLSPAKDGFREDISRITRFDLLAGLAYKL